MNLIWENFKKNNNSNPSGRKHPDRNNDGLDGSTLFDSALQATARLLPWSKKITEQMVLNISN